MNVGTALLALGHEAPELPAVVAYARTRGAARSEAPRVEATYGELRERAVRIALAYRHAGLTPGDRVSVFVRPSPDLVAVTWAAFLEGLVPVFIDPGLPRPALLTAIERTAPRAMVGVREAQLAKRLFPRSFRSIEHSFLIASPRLPFLGRSLDRLSRNVSAADAEAFVAREMKAEDPAAILFTSGSTGPAKGVLQTHSALRAQVDALQELFEFERGEADLAGLPAFALFAPAFGLTAVFPDMDPTRAEACDPERLANAIREQRTSNAFGSPTIWKRLVPWAKENGVRFDSLKRVLIAGAAVPPPLLEALAEILPEDAEIHTPYGATEALPVACISAREIRTVEQRPGDGTCVGRPTPSAEVRLIKVSDEPIDSLHHAAEVAQGDVGEICVRGSFVSQTYADLPEATRRAKIVDPDDEGVVWHRMGDLGSLDADGQLWFQGRIAHRVETTAGRLASVPTEQLFDGHPRIARVALVGFGERGKQRPFLIAEPRTGQQPRDSEDEDRLRNELIELGRKRSGSNSPPQLAGILFDSAFPTDVRHNVKIRREDLARRHAHAMESALA